MSAEEEQGQVIEQEQVEVVRDLPAVRAAESMMSRVEVTPQEVAAQRDKIEQVMHLVMKEGVHYGKVPGVSKPTLLKPGAEVLAVTFRLAPYYDSQRIFTDDGHLTVVSKVTLRHIPTDLVVAEGEGLCTSRETKYAYRKGERVCPACGEAAIKKSRFAPKPNDYPGANPSDPPGWYCFAKIGGCGANYKHDDPAIVEQGTERVANPDLADTWNTVLKMGNKRGFVAAILNGTAASDVFTQDVEDSADAAREEKKQADRWNGPKTWPEIGERIRTHLGEAEAAVWVGQALEAAFGVTSARELAEEDRVSAGERLSAVIHALDDRVAATGDFPPATRAEVQEAFAAAFDGVAPDGPPWRIGPGEDDRPDHEAWAAAEQERVDEAEESRPRDGVPAADEQDAVDIPFGEPEGSK